MSVRIHQGSILECDVDVIVNPANSFLRHGGGLAAAINGAASGLGHNGYVREDWPEPVDHDAYTAARIKYDSFAPGLIPTGGAVLGPPGLLERRFQGIIHAVGPIWGGGDYLERPLLNLAYKRALILARQNEYSIALPAISAGIFGVPIGIVAYCAIQAVQSVWRVEGDKDVVFALMDDEHVETFKRVGHELGMVL